MMGKKISIALAGLEGVVGRTLTRAAKVPEVNRRYRRYCPAKVKEVGGRVPYSQERCFASAGRRWLRKLADVMFVDSGSSASDRQFRL